MAVAQKLFLYSLQLSSKHYLALAELVGKNRDEIQIGMIENATDIIPGSLDWLGSIRQPFIDEGFKLEIIDLKLWSEQTSALAHKLAAKDVIFVGGGHTYYLRWVLKHSGADTIIKKLVQAGKVYAGWSAGAVVAGPTIQFFDEMGDDPKDAPELITEGLNLTSTTVIPHIDHPDFATGAKITLQKLAETGASVCPLNDDQVLIMNGDKQTIL